MALDDDIRLLRRSPFFATLSGDALRLVAFSAEPRRLATDDVLFRFGEPSDSGYLVRSGALELRHGGTHTTAGPDALVGALALIAETERPAEAVAREPTQLIRVTRLLFRRVLEEDPDGAMRLEQLLRAQLQQTGHAFGEAQRLFA